MFEFSHARVRVRSSVNVGINFPPRPLLLPKQVPSPSRIRPHAPLRTLPLGGRKEGGIPSLRPSLPRASFSPTRQGGRVLLTQRSGVGHFCVGEGGRSLARSLAGLGWVGVRIQSRPSPSLPLSLPPSSIPEKVSFEVDLRTDGAEESEWAGNALRWLRLG